MTGPRRAASRPPEPYQPGPPTIAQLLVLADRAETGLTAAEAARLRQGIRALSDPPQPPAVPGGVCGRTESVSGTVWPPCARPPGHPEAYCRSADGHAHFLARTERSHP